MKNEFVVLFQYCIGMGNSKLPMKIMLAMNILNVLCSTILILLFHMGTVGIAIPALVARILGIGVPFGIENGMFYISRI